MARYKLMVRKTIGLSRRDLEAWVELPNSIQPTWKEEHNYAIEKIHQVTESNG